MSIQDMLFVTSSSTVISLCQYRVAWRHDVTCQNSIITGPCSTWKTEWANKNIETKIDWLTEWMADGRKDEWTDGLAGWLTNWLIDWIRKRASQLHDLHYISFLFAFILTHSLNNRFTCLVQSMINAVITSSTSFLQKFLNLSTHKYQHIVGHFTVISF